MNLVKLGRYLLISCGYVCYGGMSDGGIPVGGMPVGGMPVGGMSGAVLSAAEPLPTAARVREALRPGWEGDLAEQQMRLNNLLASHPDLLVARGHAGFVRQAGAWVKFDEVGRSDAEREQLRQYQELRREMVDSWEGHLELANWCQKQGLTSQEQAHLRGILEHDADHAPARARLGYEKLQGEWVSRRERAAADAHQEAREEALRKYRPQIRELVLALSNKSGGKAADAQERAKLMRRLSAITDPGAVSALEAELLVYLEKIDQQPGSTEHKIADVLVPVVSTIGRIPHPEAAECLARLATQVGLLVPMEVAEAYVLEKEGPRYPTAEELSRAMPVVERLSRELAAVYRESITQLKKQPRDSFVPYLLSGLTSPIQGQYNAFCERDGDVVVRLFYQRETENRVEGLENRTKLNAVGANPVGKARSQALSGQFAVSKIVAADQILRQQNVSILHRNLRVTDVLRAVTGLPFSTFHEEWWNWWNNENEVFLAYQKPTVRKVRKESYVVIAPPPPPPLYSVVGYGPSRPDSSSSDNRKMDCLAAGTTIWTTLGPAAVDKLRIGDLVLAQHPETGELAYKPVIKTTVRPAAPLVEIALAGETLRTSGGHPFWVIGEGWVRARQLQAGQKLHGIRGPVAIERVTNVAAEEETYNLVVDEFHSYFVGEGRVLSHDNRVRRPIGNAVPGVARQP
jgi:hypothetical protein